MSVERYLDQNFPSGHTFVEGGADFDELRRHLLREADSYILHATSWYARSLMSLRSSASSWCLVGLYYSAFYAGKAIMSILGCWKESDKSWIEVSFANPGQQKLVHHKGNKDKYSTKYPAPGPGGSHREFWYAYYSAVGPLNAWISPSGQYAIKPMSASYTWFIDLKNKVNYDAIEAFKLMRTYELQYKATNLPHCFPGDLSSAYQVSKGFLSALQEIGKYCGLSTDLFKPAQSRESALRKLVNGPRKRPVYLFASKESPNVIF